MLAAEDLSRSQSAPLARSAGAEIVAAMIVATVDFLILVAIGAGTLWQQIPWQVIDLQFHAIAVMSCSAACVLTLARNRLYNVAALRRLGLQLGWLLQTVLVVFGLLFLSVIALRLPEPWLRVWVFWWTGGSLVGLAATRLVWWRWAVAALSRGAYSRRVAIIGATPQAERFLAKASGSSDVSYRVVGIYDDRRSRLPNLAVAGGTADLEQVVRQGMVDDVLLAMPWAAEARIRNLAESLRLLPVDVRLLPDLAGFLGQGPQRPYLPGVPIRDLMPRPITERGLLLKTIIDKVVASLLLVVLSPLLLLIAIAVKLSSPGPILFRQRRYGFNNGTFDLLKFRSMRVQTHAERELRQAVRGDPRVTCVGAVLRRTSMDELPQLFNVLSGSMSLIGPRPHAVQHHELYDRLIQGYSFRHKVKPGITGWAQVNGLRGETATVDRMAARVAHDVFYVENWSLWFDFKILFRTVVVLLFQSMAY